MTSAQTAIEQELAQFGWVESMATNSISDFKSPKLNIVEQEPDFIDKSICYLIFYIIFCCSLFLYLLIDKGYVSFLKTKVTTLIKK